MKAIEVKDLSFAYGEKQVLNHLSLDIEQGEFVSILGHNGSGKSTLARLILGLLEPNEGTIKINGLTLEEKNLEAIREVIGMVFQNPDNQFIGCTVSDDIAFGLENLQVPSEKMPQIIKEVSKEVGMEAFLDHEPEKLSGGQKQRVAIAGILAMQLGIVIFDEATSMLDPKGRKLINQLIHKIHQKQNLTVINITHDVEEALLSNRVVVLDEGKIIKSGKPEEIFVDDALLKKTNLVKPYRYQVIDELKKYHINMDASLSLEGIVDRLWELK